MQAEMTSEAVFFDIIFIFCSIYNFLLMGYLWSQNSCFRNSARLVADSCTTHLMLFPVHTKS
jgi:hypothetical protein